MKKWRDLILPEAAPNGQIKAATTTTISSEISRSNSPDLSQLKCRKRSIKDKVETNAKRSVLNGQREYEFSDNSNCSIKDLKKTDVIFINSDSNSSMPEQSNDSFSRSQSNDAFEDTAQQPKKRGRKKGSRNHKNLLVAAEESFSNKMSAISRNSKVKTTQELLADLQNRTVKPDIELRAAQLTESLSRIDQKLNPQKKLNQNVVPMKNDKTNKIETRSITNSVKSEPELDTRISRLKQEMDAGGSSRVSTPEIVVLASDDEIVDVVGTDPPAPPPAGPVWEPLTIEGIRSKLPPIDRAAMEAPEEFPLCTCPVPACEEPDNITVQIVSEDKKEPYNSIFCSSPTLNSPKSEQEETYTSKVIVNKSDKEIVCDEEEDETILNCPTRLYIQDKYKLDCVSDMSVENIKSSCLRNINGNYGLKTENQDPALQENGLYVNIVPNLESLRKDLSTSCSYLPASENYNKYSISISENRYPDTRNCDTVKDKVDPTNHSDNGPPLTDFREWHETVDIESYNGESLRILPYVIID